MSAPVIRPLTLEDLDDALVLSAAVGWNQRLDDWQMLLRLAPAGAFAAVVDTRGGVVGTAIGIDYGAFAWIAMMLVDPAYRGRGLGRRLLEAAIDAVPSSLPIRLDATPLGRPLYQRYGFRDEATLSRHVIDEAKFGEPHAERSQPASLAVRPLTDADMDLVVEQDRETFGGTRGALLDWAFRGATEYAYVVRSNKSDRGPVHYCLGRRGRLFDQIGPVVAGDGDIAHALVSAAVGAAGDRRVVVDAFDPSAGSGPGSPARVFQRVGAALPRAQSRGDRAAFAAALRADGFVVQRPLVRMFRAADARESARASSQANISEFAILGPEFG